jgi:ribosomal protein S18
MASSSLTNTLVSAVARRHVIRSTLCESAGHGCFRGVASGGWSRQQLQHGEPWQQNLSLRYFSRTSDKNESSSRLPVSKGRNNTTNTNNTNSDDEIDPFGVFFEDGSDLGKLGPKSPPRYKRDAVTGKFTGEQEIELTVREKKLLNMDPIEEQNYLLDKVMKEWNIDSKDGGEPEKLSKLAKRIQEDNMGINTLGRSVASQSYRGKLEDGDDAYVDKSGFSKPLSPAEFKGFQKHMKDEYDIPIDENDIPVEPTNQRGDESILGGYADTEELDSKWMSSSAMRFMDDTLDEDPFSDLLPSDLSPSRLVNRRKAKPIPRQLLHHNNLALLRRYITPAGQIMNRVQSRLGAKDQRKIAKLIKRARHLGLLPTSGHFVVESHGNIHEKDIHHDRDWEQELKRRGLILKKSEPK